MMGKNQGKKDRSSIYEQKKMEKYKRTTYVQTTLKGETKTIDKIYM